MSRNVLYTLRHVGGPTDGTIIDVVEEDGETTLVVRELHVKPGRTGGTGTVEVVSSDEGG